MCLAVMKCDRGKSNVCIYALLNYSGLSAEARCLFSVLMRASLLGAVAVAFANFTHARTHMPHQESKLCLCQFEGRWWQPVLSIYGLCSGGKAAELETCVVLQFI